MRIPVILGCAIGCGAILASEYAFPRDTISWRSNDPDLVALEKLNQRAKKAMEAFVLRPRVSDPHDSVCRGCTSGVAAAPQLRIERASVALGALERAALRVETASVAKPKFVRLAKRAKHAVRARQKLARGVFRLKRSIRRIAMPLPGLSWEAELRR